MDLPTHQEEGPLTNAESFCTFGACLVEVWTQIHKISTATPKRSIAWLRLNAMDLRNCKERGLSPFPSGPLPCSCGCNHKLLCRSTQTVVPWHVGSRDSSMRPEHPAIYPSLWSVARGRGPTEPPSFDVRKARQIHFNRRDEVHQG